MKKYLTLNLEEQVQKNASDIQAIIDGNVVLGELGIRVVGQVDTETELPDPATYLGAYGDAFLVGTDTPYNYYIFTRPFVGEDTPQWFNIGQFPVPGPQGERGPAGEVKKGDRGSVWYVGQTLPTQFSPAADDYFREQDMYLDSTTGNVYQYANSSWLLKGNITGPRGIQGPIGQRGSKWYSGTTSPGQAGLSGVQSGDMYLETDSGNVYQSSGNGWFRISNIRGPQGEQGMTGVAATIIAELPSTDQLPDPSMENRNNGYLVDINGVYHLYVITQTSIDDPTLIWTDMGQYGGYYDIVYSPNGTMLSQKLDGNGSFPFDNEPSGVTKQFTEATRIGTYSVSLGGKSAATGKRAVAEGTATWASGDYSHAEGNKSYAKGTQAHAEGAQTYAEGDESHAEGYITYAKGLASHAEGYDTKAMGSYCHSEGYMTTAQYNASHAEGCETNVSYQYGHAEGYKTTASSQAAHAEGYNTTASGWISHAEGNTTTASGTNAHAEGQNTFATGDCSHAEGQGTHATSLAAHASGIETVAQHTASAAMGKGTYTNAHYQLVCGSYNAAGNDLFTVGNGTGPYARSNAFAVVSSTTPTIKIGNTTLTEAQLQALLNLI